MTSSQLTEPSVADMLERTLHDAGELVRAEVALAKREAVEHARSFMRSAVLLIAAVMLVQTALTALGVLLVLAVGAGAWGAAVVGGFAAVALALGLIGVRLLKGDPLKSVRRVKQDAREIMAAVK